MAKRPEKRGVEVKTVKYYLDDGFPPEEREEIYRNSHISERKKQRIIQNIAFTVHFILSTTVLVVGTITLVKVVGRLI